MAASNSSAIPASDTPDDDDDGAVAKGGFDRLRGLSTIARGYAIDESERQPTLPGFGS
jgi:hypothetical protein